MKYLIGFLLCWSAWGALNDVDRQEILSKNILKNGGFENGKADWTASGGAFSIASSGSNLLAGKVSATWDASSSGQKLCAGAITIPNGLKNSSGVVTVKTMVPSGTATHSLEVLSGSVTLASNSITSTSGPSWQFLNFPFPDSGTIQPCLVASADEPSITLDEWFLGDANQVNISQVSQATYVGGMENPGANSCAYSQNTSSAITNFVDLGTGTGCAAWTVDSRGPGVISAVGTGSHQLTYTNMPPGEYQFVLTGWMGTGDAGSYAYLYRLSDGTNAYQPNGGITPGAMGGIAFHVSITSTATRTFKVQAADNGLISTSWHNAAGFPASWKIYRFPTSSELAYKPSTVPFLYERWFHNDCGGWSRSSATLGKIAGDASCTILEKQNVNAGTPANTTNGALSITPGVSLYLPRASTYEWCLEFSEAGSASGAQQAQSFVCNNGATTLAVAQKSHFQAGSASELVNLCGYHKTTGPGTWSCELWGAADSGDYLISAVASSPAARLTVKDVIVPTPTPFLLTHGDVELHLTNGNGMGSTATRIRRYSNVQKNTLGEYATYADSATNGMSVTINRPGVYAFTVGDSSSGAATNIGISVNSAALTTDVNSVSYANGARGFSTTATASYSTSYSVTLNLAAGDVVRAHTYSNNNSTGPDSMFIMTRV